MPTRGNPSVRARVEPELRDRYALACEQLGRGTMSEDLRAHIESVVAEYGRLRQRS